MSANRCHETDEAGNRPHRQQNAESEDRHAAPGIRNAKQFTAHGGEGPGVGGQATVSRIAGGALPSEDARYRFATNSPMSADPQLVDQTRLADFGGQSHNRWAVDFG